MNEFSRHPTWLNGRLAVDLTTVVINARLIANWQADTCSARATSM